MWERQIHALLANVSLASALTQVIELKARVAAGLARDRSSGPTSLTVASLRLTEAPRTMNARLEKLPESVTAKLYVTARSASAPLPSR